MSDAAFLRQLAKDPDTRNRYVDALRSAAAVLENNAQHWGFYLNTDHGNSPEAAVAMAFASCKNARTIRELAQRLCDHARLNSDGTCRYCDAVMASPS